MTSHQQGFTLVEMLVALAVFAMIAGLTYSALGVAGSGFEQLSQSRDKMERSGWIGRQLRMDLRYLSEAPVTPGGQIKNLASGPVPLRIINDNRGRQEFDQLWLLVREPGRPSLTQVHYFIDEDIGHLIRESRMLSEADSVKPLRWDFGVVNSWAIVVQDADGNLRQDWDFAIQAFQWPKAVEVTMQPDDKDSGRAMEWLMPVMVGSRL